MLSGVEADNSAMRQWNAGMMEQFSLSC